LIKNEIYQADHIFDTDTETINCINGEIRFIDGQFLLQSHRRETYRTAQIPVKFESSATAPRFRQFLSEIFVDDPDPLAKQQLIAECMGYTLLSTCELEKFFILVGNGANGKSVLLSVMEAICGRDNVSAVQPTQFENKFQRAHLQGKLANIVTEIAEGAELPDAALKAIVSGELATAERKHRDPFNFRPFATLWYATNHLPATRDFSNALFRRAKILPFNRVFQGEECDPNLKEKLLGELPGILNFALEGLARLLETRAFTECLSELEAKNEWRKQCDQVEQFVEDRCRLGSDCWMTSKNLYDDYKGWAADVGISRRVSQRGLTTRLRRFNVEPRKGTGGERLLNGIELKPIR